MSDLLDQVTGQWDEELIHFFDLEDAKEILSIPLKADTEGWLGTTIRGECSQ